MLGYLSADIICSEKQTVFQQRSSRKRQFFLGNIQSCDVCKPIVRKQEYLMEYEYIHIYMCTEYSVLNYVAQILVALKCTLKCNADK